jgi:hypothetical protein
MYSVFRKAKLFRYCFSSKHGAGVHFPQDCEIERKGRPKMGFPSSLPARAFIRSWSVEKRGSDSVLAPVADLAKVALVAAAYPLTIVNSMATCLWDTPVDYYPQSPSCPDFDHRRFDFSQVYKSCGPPGVHSERCCDTVWALSSIIYFERINRTRMTLFEVRARGLLGGASKCRVF